MNQMMFSATTCILLCICSLEVLKVRLQFDKSVALEDRYDTTHLLDNVIHKACIALKDIMGSQMFRIVLTSQIFSLVK